MNVIKFDEYGVAFIFPDDMSAFMKRYGVDALFLDAEQGVITGIGPNDKDWREIPGDVESGAKITTLKKVE